MGCSGLHGFTHLPGKAMYFYPELAGAQQGVRNEMTPINHPLWGSFRGPKAWVYSLSPCLSLQQEAFNKKGNSPHNCGAMTQFQVGISRVQVVSSETPMSSSDRSNHGFPSLEVSTMVESNRFDDIMSALLHGNVAPWREHV